MKVNFPKNVPKSNIITVGILPEEYRFLQRSITNLVITIVIVPKKFQKSIGIVIGDKIPLSLE
jgi:hypothetical protein